VERYIEERDSHEEEKADIVGGKEPQYDFIGQVANKRIRSRVQPRDRILNVLLAGRDTTACCLSWTLFVSKPADMTYLS
jgi:cytochrome P450